MKKVFTVVTLILISLLAACETAEAVPTRKFEVNLSSNDVVPEVTAKATFTMQGRELLDVTGTYSAEATVSVPGIYIYEPSSPDIIIYSDIGWDNRSTDEGTFSSGAPFTLSDEQLEKFNNGVYYLAMYGFTGAVPESIPRLMLGQIVPPAAVD